MLTVEENFRKTILTNYALFCVRGLLNSSYNYYFQNIVDTLIQVRQRERSRETEKEKEGERQRK